VNAAAPRTLQYAEFVARVEAAVGQRGDGICAALVVDLGEIWRMDGALGLRPTDELVSGVAERLGHALRGGDTVGHIGRHRLACLLVNLPSREHALLAANKAFSVVSEVTRVGEQVIFLNPRIGIAEADATCDSGDELLRRATKAATDARTRHERTATYDGTGDPLALLQFDMHADLKQAIESNDLRLCYQPKINLATERVMGAEALLRWSHPKRGEVPLGRLVEVAEATGLMADLTQWVVNTALRECAEYRRQGVDIGVSINLSPSNLREPDIAPVVAQALELWGVPPDKVALELTETAVMDDQPHTLDAIVELKDLGVELSMDDFGTGYSSMARLRDLPLDELKIEMTFVRNINKAPVHEHIVQSMVGLAHGLNLRVVAEGVEDHAILASLREMGCDCVQGYLFGKPAPLAEFISTARAIKGIPRP
jgi:EAL domain-containing protein (putative c-di-GMP-specific phosphodiesterase class I)/GGDEF domain-containing protein